MDQRKLYIVEADQLDRLIGLLRLQQYAVIGPTVRDDVIVYDEIAQAQDLPVGITDEQQPGRYRIRTTGRRHYFQFVVGPHSWKQFLFPPRLRIFAAKRTGTASDPYTIDTSGADPPKYAFLGVRACELAAIAIQDKIILSEITGRYYQMAREQAFIVAVNCLEPGGTCFCASMKTGPRCLRDFDLCLTELDGNLGLEVGSEAGAAMLQNLESREANATEQRLFHLLLERSREHMGRRMETEGLAELLAESLESSRWEKIAQRCLACANCTMACPTCFCYNVYDYTDLRAKHAERRRRWGSCFTLEFSYMGGQNARTSIASRYRQWMVHKLSTWHEQFGSSGCVGCGRCITWCPVGIDITEEAAAFRRDAESVKQAELQHACKE